jgi:hypothetical protein
MATNLKIFFRLPTVGPPVVVTPPVVTPTALAAPATSSAYALSSSSISYTCSSVQGAVGYVLEVALTANGQYTEVYRGISSNFTQKDLPASSPRYGRWEALGNGTTTKDSAYSSVASATTQPEVAPGTRVYGEIPYNPEWAFVDDVSTQNLTGFFDGVLNVNVELNGGGGATQPGSVIVFRFPEQMGVELAELQLGDGQHDNPTGIECWTIDPTTEQRVYQFNFKGDTGNGVIDKHTLAAPVRSDAFLFRWGYPLPTEVKFFGWYTPYTPAPYVPDPVNMDGMAGYVSYIYDFCLPSGQGPDGIKLELSTCGSFYRLYVDAGLMYVPDSGLFTFSPMKNGAWDLDGVLDRLCRVLGMRVMICPKGQEGATWYPELCKQLAIRYGNNANVADSQVKLDLRAGFGPTSNVIKKGLGTTYQYAIIIQCGNEQWRWWKGDADLANQQNLEGNITPYESYVIQKACYDGIKSVSPTTEVSIGGTPSNAPGIVQGILWYCDLYNGGNIVFDSVSYHDYLNTNGGQNAGGSPVGVQPELNNALYEHGMRFGRVLQQWAHGKKIKVYITETGWSTANHVGANPEQTAPATAQKDTFRVAADWVLRAGTEGARAGLVGIAGYQLYNDPNYLDNLDGYTNWDTSNGEAGQSPSGDQVFLLPASDAKKQRLGLLRGYTMVSSDASDPDLRIHKYTKAGSPDVYSVHKTSHNDSTRPVQLAVPTGQTATLQTINFGVMSKVFAYVRPSVPIITSNNGLRTVKASHPDFAASELEYMMNWSYQWQPYNGETFTAPTIGDTYQFRVKRLNPGRNVSFIAGSPSFTANPGVTADVVSVSPIASYNVYYDRYTPGTQAMDSQALTVANGTVTVTASETPCFVVLNPAPASGGTTSGTDARVAPDPATGPPNVDGSPIEVLSSMAGTDGVIRLKGVYKSTNPAVAAVSCNCGATPVDLSQALVIHAGRGVSGGDNTNITMRDVSCYGLLTAVDNQTRERNIHLSKATNIDIQYVTFETGGGIYCEEWRGNHTASQTVKIQNIKSRNIIGSNGAGPDGAGGYRSIVQLKDIRTKGMLLKWIEGYNEPGKSRIEDSINLFRSGGYDIDNPLRGYGLYINGSFPFGELSTDYTGCAISIDGGYDTSAGERPSAFNILEEIWTIDNCNAACNLSVGNDNHVRRIRAVTSGYLPDGRRLNMTYKAFNINDFYNQGQGANNTISEILDSYYARTKDLAPGVTRRAEFVADINYDPNPNPGIDVANAILLPDVTTPEQRAAIRANAFMTWRDFLNVNNQTCGSRYKPS